MPLVIDWAKGSLLLTEEKTAIVGRDNSVDVTVASARVSRHHLRVAFQGGVWVAEDLDSSNGTFHQGKAAKRTEILEALELKLGAREGPVVSFTVIQSANSSLANTEATSFTSRADISAVLTSAIPIGKRIALRPRTRIGRDAANEVVFGGDLLVSRFHAEIVQTSDGCYSVVDLRSANGTFLNGQPIKRAPLTVGDLLTIGSTVMTYSRGALEPVDESGGFAFTANGIGLVIGGKRLLSQVSFDLKPRSLTAIVGPSGSGKSTLLSVLSGQRQPTNGTVQFAGRDLHQSYSELKNRIGLVPQADLLHTNLKTRRALEYGASLRLPRDTTPQERRDRVSSVMEDLGLTKRADLRIDKLSGGQKKRASVALELITDPELLFLDEPTSGLDPGLDRQVMNMLRGLADSGRSVLIVTHSTANLDVCDDIVVLAAGGHLAYFGSPFGVLGAFSSTDWADVFERLEEGDYSRIGDTTEHSANRKPLKPVEFSFRRQQSWSFQFFQQAKRYLEVMASDPPYLALTVSLPFILGLVAQITGSELGLGPGDEESFFLNPEARSSLLIILLGAVFMGSAAAVQEIVKERVIYQRERSTGLSRSSYLMSKVVVLSGVGIAQAAAFVLIATAGRPLPEDALIGDNSLLLLLWAVVMLTVVSIAVGLLLSTLANSPEVTMPFLVVSTMAQVVLSGAVPLVSDWILDVTRWFNPTFWAMNSLASVTDLNVLTGSQGDDLVDLWTFDMENYVAGIIGLGVALVVFLILAGAGLAKNERHL